MECESAEASSGSDRRPFDNPDNTCAAMSSRWPPQDAGGTVLGLCVHLSVHLYISWISLIVNASKQLRWSSTLIYWFTAISTCLQYYQGHCRAYICTTFWLHSNNWALKKCDWPETHRARCVLGRNNTWWRYQVSDGSHICYTIVVFANQASWIMSHLQPYLW